MQNKQTKINSTHKLISNIQFASHFVAFEAKEFSIFIQQYSHKKFVFLSQGFESNKNIIVKSVLLKRGRLNRMFLHICAMVVILLGLILSPFITDSNPFNQKNTNVSYAQESQNPNPLAPSDVFQTQATDAKQRSSIISYTVQKGDTVSLVAKRFNISEDTIKWENNLSTDSITVGDELKILPITGIAHKVERGDTIYTIAKKYDANPQSIVDYQFNEFANPQTFSLVEGQILFVPDGVKPEEKPKYQNTRLQYIATGPVDVKPSGYAWPTQGVISQYFSWYHPAIDIAAPIGTPIVASENGQVINTYPTGWNSGYGTNVRIRGATGNVTLYAHMMEVDVTPGQIVSAGKTLVGRIGITGKTTGPHLHFEIRGESGSRIDPMEMLK